MRSKALLVSVLLALAILPGTAFAQAPSLSPNLPPAALPTPAGISIAGLPATAATNQLLTLTANLTLDPGSSLTSDIGWDFGDGGTATGSSVTHAYRSAGSYDVRVSAGATGAVGAGTISTDAQVTVQDSVTIQPGDSIMFASPYVPFTPPPGSPPPPAIFGPLNVEVDDGSDQPLAVSYSPSSSANSLSANQADLGLALPDDYALQVLSPAGISGPRPGVDGCVPSGAGPSEADCTLSLSSMPSRTIRLNITAADATAVQGLTLAPSTYESAILLGPSPPAGSGGVPLLYITGASDQTTAITWDGATLAIAAPGGYAVAVDGARSLPQPAAAVPIDCSTDEDQPSAMQCAVAAIPPVEVSYHTVVQAPSGTLTLPYSDDQGQGTMTIANVGPDVAPGGATINVTLTQGGDTLNGSGVMRPQGTGYLLAFELTDAAGNSYLYENEVTADAGGFSGKGLWLSGADETQAGPWSLGTPPGRTSVFNPGSISTTYPDSGTCSPSNSPPACLPPTPRPPLPLFTGDQLLALGQVPPPAIGQAGQPVNLIATTGAPCCGQSASQTYARSFGDGTTSPPSGQQTVTHTWTGPGVYTVAVVFTDETGVRTFTLTQVQVMPASS